LRKKNNKKWKKIADLDRQAKIKSDEAHQLYNKVKEKWPFGEKTIEVNMGINLSRVDGKIKQLDMLFSQTTMSMLEEKKLVNQINSLQTLKTTLKEYHKKLRESADQKPHERIAGKIARFEQELQNKKEDEAKQQLVVDKTQKNLQEIRTAISQGAKRKKELETQLGACVAEFDALRDKIDVQKQKWLQEKEEAKQKQIEFQKQQKKAKEFARQKRDAERK